MFGVAARNRIIVWNRGRGLVPELPEEHMTKRRPTTVLPRNNLKVPNVCIICGSKRPEMVGMFVPDKPHLFGSPLLRPRDSGTFVIQYGLCYRCSDKAETLDAVDAELERLYGRNN